jgi:DNA mismatch repair protein MutS2
MDDKSLELLEFPQIRNILAGYASFAVSLELVLGLRPLADGDRIALLLRQAAEARQLLSLEPGFSIGGASDIREAVRIAALGGILDAKNLVEVGQTLSAMRQVRSRLRQMSGELPLLGEIAGGIVELRQIEKEITHCLSPGGEILDRASPGLSAIRRQLRESRQHLWGRLEATRGAVRDSSPDRVQKGDQGHHARCVQYRGHRVR